MQPYPKNDYDATYDILFSPERIHERILELGRQITDDYSGKELTVVSMLKGSLYFLADLTRAISMPLQYDLIGINTFASATDASGIVRITRDLQLDISGRHVLVIEEIVRTGLTTHYMMQHLENKNPASLELAALVANPDQLLIDLPMKYIGFEIDYTRVIGYGMDFREHGRNLPYIAKLDKERFLNH